MGKVKEMMMERVYNDPQRIIQEEIDYTEITDVEVEGIDWRDYPDFCDSFISYAEYKGKPMTEMELDILNQDSDYVYEKTMSQIF